MVARNHLVEVAHRAHTWRGHRFIAHAKEPVERALYAVVRSGHHALGDNRTDAAHNLRIEARPILSALRLQRRYLCAEGLHLCH